MAAVVNKRFHGAMALSIAALTFAGFARTYYLREWFDVPPITMLLHLHGFAFTAWVVLFVVQTRLVAAHNYRMHMKLGIAGVAVAACVVILGFATAVVSASSPRMRPMGLTSPQFSLIPLVAITSFAILVAAAIFFRRRPQLHKRLMTLAMIAVIAPPTARLIALTTSGTHFLAIQTLMTALLVSLCLIHDWRSQRVLHPLYTIVGTFLVVSWPLRAWIAQTPAWEHAGQWLAEIGKAYV
jgi:hypothetical protein